MRRVERGGGALSWELSSGMNGLMWACTNTCRGAAAVTHVNVRNGNIFQNSDEDDEGPKDEDTR